MWREDSLVEVAAAEHLARVLDCTDLNQYFLMYRLVLVEENQWAGVQRSNSEVGQIYLGSISIII